MRGLDYYTRTTFEFAAAALDAAQNAVGGGGRYDGLAEALGRPADARASASASASSACCWPATPRACFAVDAPAPDVFVVDVTGGEAARDVTAELRRAGLGAVRAYDGRSLKAQLKLADRSGAPRAP